MNQITKTDPRLTPALPLEITQHLNQLFNALPLPDAGEMSLVMKGYVIAVEGYPEFAISEVVRDFIRGNVPGQSKKFSPRAPELSAAIRKRMEPVYEDIARTRREAQARAENSRTRSIQAPAVTPTPLGDVIDRDVSFMEWQANTAARKYPAGAKWIARTGCVHAPIAENLAF